MPPAIAAAVVAAVGATGLAATVITVAVQLAVTLGLSFLSNAIFGSGVPKPSDGQQIIREAVSSRKRHYGRVHVGGSLSFYESRNGTLGMIVTTGLGQANAVVEDRINGEVVTVGAGGVLSAAKFHGAIRIIKRLGTDNQTAISEMTAIFSEWTTNHRQRGCTLAAIICDPVDQKHFSEVYEGNRQPEYTQVLEGALCYDPRKDSTRIIGYDAEGDPIMGSGSHRLDNRATWEWTDTAALVIGDYWAHEDGFGVGAENVNWTNIAQEADICDQNVTTVGGQTIKRWRIWGSYRLAEDERKTVLQEMMKACDGYSWQDADGLLNLQVGRWIEPTVTITDDHIVSLSGSVGVKALDRTNEVKVVYTDERFDYSEQESAPVVDVAAQAALGRPESQRFDIYFAPHHNQAARLGKRLLGKLGDRWNLVVVTNLYGLNLIGKRFLYLTCEELEIDNIAFELSSLKIDFDAGTIEFGASEVRESDWDFDAALEEGEPPDEPGVVFVAPTVPVPTGLSLSAEQIQIGQTNGVGIVATWATARAGLSFIAEYRPTSGGTWINMNVNQEERSATSGIVPSGIQYEVRVKSVTISQRESGWTTPVTITPVADNSETAPSPPSSFVATGGAGEVDLSWRNPTETNFAYIRIFRHGSDDFASATQVGDDLVGALGAVQAVTDDGLAAGTYYYWLVAYSGSDLPSDETASGAVAVT